MRHARIAVGHSDDIDEADAVAEAAAACRAGLGGRPPVAVAMFASAEYASSALGAAAAASLPGAVIVGCAGDGQFCDARGHLDDGVVMLAFAEGTGRFSAALGEGFADDAYAATGRAITSALGEGDAPPSMAFVFLSNPRGNVSSVLRAFHDLLGEGLPVLGGVGGDWDLGQGWAMADGGCASDAVSVLLVWGGLDIGVGTQSGWRRVGPSYRATRCDGNLLSELDGRPAASVLERQFGPRVLEGLVELPLAVVEGGDVRYLRAVYGAQAKSGALVLAGEVPEGAELCLTAATHEQILHGTQTSLDVALDSLEGRPEALLVVSCVARKWVLGHDVSREIEILRAGCPGLPIAGFFAQGEIGPVAGVNRFHNCTCVVVALGGE